MEGGEKETEEGIRMKGYVRLTELSCQMPVDCACFALGVRTACRFLVI